jgi:hypothetical protein
VLQSIRMADVTFDSRSILTASRVAGLSANVTAVRFRIRRAKRLTHIPGARITRTALKSGLQGFEGASVAVAGRQRASIALSLTQPRLGCAR